MIRLMLISPFPLAYAVYFDHKRQTDPDFRKSLKRNNRRMARAVKEEVEAQGAQERETIKQVVQQAKDEGFPTDLEEKEAYFMGQVAKGESICGEGMCLMQSPSERESVLTIPPRCRQDRGCSLLLQGPQGLPPAQGPDRDL